MRLFGSDRIRTVVDTLGLEENQAIENKMLTGAIENSQSRVEGRNFDIRKHVLQYDDVMNQQREIIYSQRQQVLNGDSIKSNIQKMIGDFVEETVLRFAADENNPENWNIGAMTEFLETICLKPDQFKLADEELMDSTREGLINQLTEIALENHAQKEEESSEEMMRELERVALLRSVDTKWIDHIDAMEQLKHGIGLRAYGQQDPVMLYKFEGFDMFEEMIAAIRESTLKLVFNAKLNAPAERVQVANPIKPAGDGTVAPKQAKADDKIGRNDPCPCGSGKKYKKCCGANKE